MNIARFAPALAAILGGVLCLISGAGAADAMPPPEVGVVAVATQPVSITQELNGRVSPFLVAEVRPQVNGIILSRLFEEGGAVQKDQQLYQIDPAIYEANLASAEATLARANANVALAEAKLARYERLIQASAVNQQEYDEVEAASKQAQAEVGIAEANVRLQQINVDYAKVLSPISGRIGKSSVTQGALVNAGQPAALAVVQQLNPIYVDVTQPVAALGSFRGSPNTGKSQAEMRLTLDDGSEYAHPGQLLFADVTVDQTTGSISLRAKFPNPDNILLPGMFVAAKIVVETIPDGILIPQRALMRDPDGSAYVFVVHADNTVEKRIVQAPRTIGRNWLIRAGLQAGDNIVVEGTQRIRFIPGGPAPVVTPVE